MKKLIRVKDKKNLFRDESTNAIVNSDLSEYENYLKQRKSRLKKDEDIDILRSEVSSLKNDISELKELLKTIINQ